VNRPAYLDELDQLSRRGEFEEIVCRCKGILQELKTRWDEAYPETAMVLECLAHAYDDDGDYCAAAIEYERALTTHRAHSNLPSDHLVRCLMYLGRMLLWTGRPAEAEERLTEALTLLDHLPEEDQGGRGFVLVDLAQMHRRDRELEAAEQLLLSAIKPMSRFGYGNEHFDHVYVHLAMVFEEQGRKTATDRAMEKAIRWLRCVVTEDDANFATALSLNGLRLKSRGRREESRAYQAEALAMLQRIRKPGHYLLEKVKLRLAKLDEAQA